MKRVSRACLFCRQRKSKCDLDVSGGAPPCGRCLKDKRDCVLGGSNRGGSRIRKKKQSVSVNETPSQSANGLSAARSQEPLPEFSPSISQPGEQHIKVVSRHREGSNALSIHEETGPSSPDSGTAPTLPTNPSDAWQLLKDVAVGNAGEDGHQTIGDHTRRGSADALAVRNGNGVRGIWSYRLVREGHLTPDIVAGLVKDFRERYHAYLPLVPRQYYEPEALDRFAVENKHLLTAVLTIASKDIPGERNYIHECCSRYMHDLISSIAAGTDCDVEAVEALLLLAEWVPHGLRKSGHAVGRGEEDRTAWMHVGIALRTGYYLGLDRTSFRSEDLEEAKAISRKRLAWTCCYISDRLISCRIGKAFWSRGPGPMTGLSSQDFPSLQPVNEGDENHARIFTAILDLTQIYSNVHGILYTATRANSQMILMGDYVKYIDEFRGTIARWHQQYGALVCSPHIKVTLDLSYHYLQLYTNAFAFQAAISQALARKARGDPHQGRDPNLRKVFKDIGAMPDARFIFRAIESAKQYMSIFTMYVDAKTLRYMPIRYYLYCIYSAVFLYKARSFGALRSSEEPQIAEMITATVTKLKQASVNPQDSGARYARLLELLWQKSRPLATTERTVGHNSPTATVPTPPSARLSESGSGGLQGFSPTNGFSWLDLGATADYASGDQFGNAMQGILEAGPVNGDMSMGMNFMQQPPGQAMDFTGQQYPWMTSLDFNGNLPF